MFGCFGVRFVSLFSKRKPNFQNGQKSRKNRTNMDIILSFLAKPVDKHGITLVHITYPPLGVEVFFEPRTLEKEVINSFHTLLANKASCTFGISDPGIPGYTAINTEIPHDPDLNMEPTDKIWVMMC